MEQLLAARDRWIRAYFDGDVAALDSLEAPDFSSTCRLGSQAKRDQLAGIGSAIREGCWLPDGCTSEDIERHVHVVGDVAVVHGIIHTVAQGQLPPSVASTEVWQRVGSEWLALRMHFSNARR